MKYIYIYIYKSCGNYLLYNIYIYIYIYIYIIYIYIYSSFHMIALKEKLDSITYIDYSSFDLSIKHVINELSSLPLLG